ncbi:hypothetical protein E9531_16285 [Lampropedia puyangensis]|uniref:Uncharacterized protein n=1 Tax=Lampropedia puyangensis TaxID=1330072 RepID=A0A4V4GQ55_9BURK|nr:hypothetical protein [Lampropedia puyangensis]THT96395.1 hypothetical protein E9531_16285 [Lampropedia puyangensis]
MLWITARIALVRFGDRSAQSTKLLSYPQFKASMTRVHHTRLSNQQNHVFKKKNKVIHRIIWALLLPLFLFYSKNIAIVEKCMQCNEWTMRGSKNGVLKAAQQIKLGAKAKKPAKTGTKACPKGKLQKS